MKKSKFKTFIFRKKELITPKYILIMRELNSSLAPHLELWIVISLNFLKILYQKFLEKSNFQMVLLRRFELLPEDWESSVLANLTKGAYGGPGWCRSTYSQRKRVYSPPQLPICYWPICGGSPRTRTRTSCLTGKRSSQLNYGAIMVHPRGLEPLFAAWKAADLSLLVDGRI